MNALYMSVLSEVAICMGRYGALEMLMYVRPMLQLESFPRLQYNSLQVRQPERCATQAARGGAAVHRRNQVLTDDDGVVGHLLRALPVVVEGQVPEAGVQVLDESCFVDGDGASPPASSRGLCRAALLFGDESASVQQLHEVVLPTQSQRCFNGPRRRRGSVPQLAGVSVPGLRWPPRSLKHTTLAEGRR